MPAELRGSVQIVLGEVLFWRSFEPAHGKYQQTHVQRFSGLPLNRDSFVRGEGRPELFEVIEAADLGAEKVDDHVT